MEALPREDVLDPPWYRQGMLFRRAEVAQGCKNHFLKSCHTYICYELLCRVCWQSWNVEDNILISIAYTSGYASKQKICWVGIATFNHQWTVWKNVLLWKVWVFTIMPLGYGKDNLQIENIIWALQQERGTILIYLKCSSQRHIFICHVRFQVLR